MERIIATNATNNNASITPANAELLLINLLIAISPFYHPVITNMHLLYLIFFLSFYHFVK